VIAPVALSGPSDRHRCCRFQVLEMIVFGSLFGIEIVCGLCGMRDIFAVLGGCGDLQCLFVCFPFRDVVVKDASCDSVSKDFHLVSGM